MAAAGLVEETREMVRSPGGAALRSVYTLASGARAATG